MIWEFGFEILDLGLLVLFFRMLGFGFRILFCLTLGFCFFLILGFWISGFGFCFYCFFEIGVGVILILGFCMFGFFGFLILILAFCFLILDSLDPFFWLRISGRSCILWHCVGEAVGCWEAAAGPSQSVVLRP